MKGWEINEISVHDVKSIRRQYKVKKKTKQLSLETGNISL